MRLTQIKLAGFKSFVDPTHLLVSGQLVGVVGPNGCGKSNIIDAVRWVLGETKATELRGESMQDVIFNGSVGRKPAARASVELMFDNSAQTLSGAWGRFTELSVKRILTREGQSTYWINNQSVRRRDVHDLFLGTGLGPRAYAIIGQGMISRIIESKPEELRVFLEEAAGVSKYKERRKETANRLEDARENLLRVQDIREELTRQTEKLSEQAEVAERYQALIAERDDKRNLMLAARRAEQLADRDRLAADVMKAQADLDNLLAQQRHSEAALEGIRQAWDAANETQHQAQGALYEAVAQTGRLESEIRRIRDARARLERDLIESAEQTEIWAERESTLEIERIDLEERLAVAQVNEAESQAALETAQAGLAPLQSAVLSAQAVVSERRAAVSETEKSLARVAEQQRSADRQLQQLALKHERLQGERRGGQAFDAGQLVEVRESLAIAREDLSIAQESLAQTEMSVDDATAIHAERAQALASLREQRQRVRAQLETLKEIQSRAASDDAVQGWLKKHALDGRAPFWQALEIEKGWETAVEAVLEERLNALSLSKLEWVASMVQDPPPHRVAVHAVAPQLELAPDAGEFPSLASKVAVHNSDLQGVLALWLASTRCVANVETALAARARLVPGEQLIVPAGHRIDAVSVRFYAEDRPGAGLLARRQKIEGLEADSSRIQSEGEALALEVSALERALNESKRRLSELRAQQTDAERQVHRLQVDEARLLEQQAAFTQRARRLDEELEEMALQRAEAQAVLENAESTFESLDAQLGERQQSMEEAIDAVDAAQKALGEASQSLRTFERAVQTAHFEFRSAKEGIERLVREQQEAAKRKAAAAERHASLQSEHTETDGGMANEELQAALELRAEREEALGQARDQVAALSHEMRAQEEARTIAERSAQPRRDQVARLQLEEQQARLMAEQFEAQLLELQADLPTLSARLLAEEPKASLLQADVTRLSNAIAALGAVNLAALQELKAAQERLGFLESQAQDLLSAVETLEDAIRRIDRESRALMQQTFDAVNANFGVLFPKLFGGGEAKLVLTGEELLDAGVQVHAQPPGKRNSTIHLLSGGEKALTATALVFALFQLNPAPFCLLDEVDAPLDDPNTERFSRLVRTMSEKTQFLFISHNKIAMEIAETLIGVTMQEQGVSRVVAVDLQTAQGMVEETIA